MMKKVMLTMVLALTGLTVHAQWNNWHTTQAISSGFGLLGSMIESAERKKAMDIWDREKKQYQPTFKEAQKPSRNMKRWPS